MERPVVSIWIGETCPAKWENYRQAIASAGGQVFFGAKEALTAGDALLLPGGGDLEPWRYGQENTGSQGLEPERDEAEWFLLEAFLAARKPILGICRGMQSINVFLGGTLVQDIPGHSAVKGRDRLHLVRTGVSSLRALYGELCQVNSAHHQAVDRLGSGLQAAQWAPDGIVEALTHKKLPVWAVQWHPERLADRASGRRLFQAFLDFRHNS